MIINTGGVAPAAPTKTYRRRKLPYKVKKSLKSLKSLRSKNKKLRTLLTRGSDESKAFWGEDWAIATPLQKALRSASAYKGKGDYWSGIQNWGRKWVPEGTFSHIGGAAFGTPGRLLGTGLSKIVGFGDYGGDAGGNQIMANSVHTPMTVNASQDLTGDVYISHREFIGNISAVGGSGNISAFSLQKFPINAGLSTTFPWLSQVAQNFELYELQGCVFEYKPTSGELGATGTNSLGKVVMATNYDPDSGDFLSSVQMENYDYANACKPSEHMLHGIETAAGQRLSNMLYVRTGNSSKDLVLTDIGNFYIATEGLPITNGVQAIIGELWVSYRVKISRAQLFTYLGQGTKTDVLYAASDGTTNIAKNTFSFGTTQSFANQYNFVGLASNGFAPSINNSIGISAVGTGANSFTVSFPKQLNAGVYRVDVFLACASATVTHFTAPTALTNCTVDTFNALGFNTIAGPDVDGAATNTKCVQTVFIKITAPGSLAASLTFQCSTNNPPVSSQVWVIATQYPTNLFA